MDQFSPFVGRVHRYVLENLDKPSLSPRAIADAHGISVRQLHRVFRPTGTTVSQWVRKVRLARCAADLCGGAGHADAITDIAFRWGFNDSAHFSKAFRAEFGQSPRAYRANHRNGVSVGLRRSAAPMAALDEHALRTHLALL